MDGNSVIQCYGFLEKHDDPAYRVRMHIVIFNFERACLDFLTPDDSFKWESEYNRVKRFENFARMHSDVSQMSLTEKKDIFRHEHIPTTVAFAQKRGVEMVPADLRFSINDVRAAIGMPLILWPPINYIHEDGIVHTPNDVDDLGRGL